MGQWTKCYLWYLSSSYFFWLCDSLQPWQIQHLNVENCNFPPKKTKKQNRRGRNAGILSKGKMRSNKELCRIINKIQNVLMNQSQNFQGKNDNMMSVLGHPLIQLYKLFKLGTSYWNQTPLPQVILSLFISYSKDNILVINKTIVSQNDLGFSYFLFSICLVAVLWERFEAITLQNCIWHLLSPGKGHGYIRVTILVW